MLSAMTRSSSRGPVTPPGKRCSMLALTCPNQAFADVHGVDARAVRETAGEQVADETPAAAGVEDPREARSRAFEQARKPELPVEEPHASLAQVQLEAVISVIAGRRTEPVRMTASRG